MDWIAGFALLVTVLAAGSLWGAYITRQEFGRGICSYEVLACRTGVFDRKRLEALVGPPDASGRYRLTPERIKSLPRGPFNEPYLDAACVAGAVLSIPFEFFAYPAVAGSLVCACGAYQITSWGYAIIRATLHAGEPRRRP